MGVLALTSLVHAHQMQLICACADILFGEINHINTFILTR
ncbi:MAG: hypothetical protein IBGAMO2_540012 [Arenicellales bacterium IbO2]|nr:MAG: hypothetical protein IBGAMO2_540012 [Arenicellales bacterium IbO2]